MITMVMNSIDQNLPMKKQWSFSVQMEYITKLSSITYWSWAGHCLTLFFTLLIPLIQVPADDDAHPSPQTFAGGPRTPELLRFRSLSGRVAKQPELHIRLIWRGSYIYSSSARVCHFSIFERGLPLAHREQSQFCLNLFQFFLDDLSTCWWPLSVWDRQVQSRGRNSTFLIMM